MGLGSGRLSRAIFILILAGGCRAAAPAGPAVDLLVFAPHPDDETLGCAGILHQAIQAGKRVKVVLFTSGDGFPGIAALIRHKPEASLGEDDFRELARFRQTQSQEAIRAVGGSPGDLIFLGYPDAGLGAVYRTRGTEPFRQKFTGKSETYGAAERDYHESVHGHAAPYTYASALADVIEILATYRPARICVTNEADLHPDHRATFRFVQDAVELLGYPGEIDTYLIHGGPEWPWPLGSTPELHFEAHEVRGAPSPRGVPWPPSRRVPLTPAAAEAKRKAIVAHASHLAGAVDRTLKEEREYLESFVKSEEVFWTLEHR